MIKLLNALCVIFASLVATSAFAVNCQRAATPLENTICHSENLSWLNNIMATYYRDTLARREGYPVHQEYLAWQKSLKTCSSESCIERAYYAGIGKLAEAPAQFIWQGRWWNTLAANMNGGVIEFSHNADWTVNVDIRIWSGLNKEAYTGEARKIDGMLLINNMAGSKRCKVLLIPESSGALQVFSSGKKGCSLSMPSGAFIDGIYERSENDPRPEATLLSLQILPDAKTDQQFRALVGKDYQKFIQTANAYIYHQDIDNIGATVILSWLRGAANTRTAIIMYNASDIWAARIAPDEKGKLTFYYYSTQNSDISKMPRTIAQWRMRYMEQ
ncbi:hypothetical protein C3408_01230 [Candidatus Pantoea alvi]|uniref:lysozyme inhibitor LprI family protein n=1 Tax=Enterobacter agglomerans TaxID=549 RepID=UPI000CDD248D|nr:hypothetical protein [Pantoea agglomerans]POW60832.1 hypothetical protein C3408_01230 [Pantoea alvi]UBN53969.1 hypothetical protein LB453_19400 [Pantoea agglomerans]